VPPFTAPPGRLVDLTSFSNNAPSFGAPAKIPLASMTLVIGFPLVLVNSWASTCPIEIVLAVPVTKYPLPVL